ncbi:MAG: tRNA uridine-5-carboxymethylaminomethyl(34) synthesis GTPase MnmE [Clostridia bacterium]|nr:tRNA uridine-5-carboxymethylaminomethyl(34) synthesis GTPase MnmE [Clostridia bacterium]
MNKVINKIIHNVQNTTVDKTCINFYNIIMNDVIVAVCTPMLKSALCVIRVSGEGTEKITRQLFGELEPRRVYYKNLVTEKITDSVVAVFFRAPASFTGDDTLEITCHGNPLIANAIVEHVYKLGARPAQNGEFTRRAYLNGKTDLTGAEAIKDIIDADTEKGVNLAYSASEGALFNKIREIQENLRDLIAQTEVAIDYPEEELEEFTQNQLQTKLVEIKSQCENLKNSYESGKIIKEGVKVAIIGKPNAGKSSLLNRLVGEETAIVTEIEGTTRDVVRGKYIHRGICFLVADTAGLRDAEDTVEKIGVRKSKEEAEESDLVVYLRERGDDFEQFINKISVKKRVIVVKNKSDVECDEDAEINVSALTGKNIDALKDKICEACVKGVDAEVMLTNRRQYDCMCECESNLKNALQNLGCITLDCISSDLELGYNALGKITGLIGSDEIIDSIFRNFCVGK